MPASRRATGSFSSITTHNPTWEQVRVRAALDANTTMPLTVERDMDGQTEAVQQTSCLADQQKGQDFEIESLGLLPREQPVR